MAEQKRVCKFTTNTIKNSTFFTTHSNKIKPKPPKHQKTISHTHQTITKKKHIHIRPPLSLPFNSFSSFSVVWFTHPAGCPSVANSEFHLFNTTLKCKCPCPCPPAPLLFPYWSTFNRSAKKVTNFHFIIWILLYIDRIGISC